MITTFYLKYRPQKLQDLDSVEAREELISIFASGKFPHAFLFSGPKGIGKTSAARIVAKAINCTGKDQRSKIKDQSKNANERALDFEPCNECESCTSITNGTNIDVLEIDAASNRGIDDIKELREKIKLSPAASKFKVYIIDEVHMLTTEAFNALLKTLEEPPAHAVFVLCTTDPEKLPKTITSRCLIVNFKKATKKEIVGKLKDICEKENFEFEQSALEEIAKLSEGSFRDANKILEQISFSGKIFLAEVKKLAGFSSQFNIGDFLELLYSGKTKDALLWLNNAVEQGVSSKILTERLLDKLRLFLLSNFGVNESGEEKNIGFSVEELLFLINLFTKAYSELRYSVISQLPLEIAIIEWSESQCKVVGGGGKSDVISTSSGVEKEKSSEASPREDFSPRQCGVRNDKVGSFTLDDVLVKWPEILEKVKPMNHSVLAFLKACKPKSCEDGYLVLDVFYKFHKDQLEKDQCRKIFEKAAGEVLGCGVKMKCNLSENHQPPKELPKVDFFPPPPISVSNSQKSDSADIIKLAEEIFTKGGTIQ